jgi:hypothetical protein
LTRNTAAARPGSTPIGESFRRAFVDFYFNSGRLVAANLAWGVVFSVVLYGTIFVTPLMLVLSPLLALPTAGVFRVAALIARGEAVELSDAFGAWRRFAVPSLLTALGLQSAVLILGGNLVLGLASGTLPGLALATMSAWGLIASGAFAVVVWPLLMDPWRDGESLRARARVAALMIVAFPVRLIALAAFCLLILLLSTVAYMMVFSVSVAYVALVTSRYLLPAADKLVPPARLREV